MGGRHGHSISRPARPKQVQPLPYPCLNAGAPGKGEGRGTQTEGAGRRRWVAAEQAGRRAMGDINQVCVESTGTRGNGYSDERTAAVKFSPVECFMKLVYPAACGRRRGAGIGHAA
jgi:hypothetical protein